MAYSAEKDAARLKQFSASASRTLSTAPQDKASASTAGNAVKRLKRVVEHAIKMLRESLT
jgi:hypothetical protein